MKWAKNINTCLGKCRKHMLGQMLEIYGLANLYLIKRGGLAPPFYYILFGQSIYFQHLAKHVFPAFAQACVYVFLPISCVSFLPVSCVYVFRPFRANFLLLCSPYTLYYLYVYYLMLGYIILY